MKALVEWQLLHEPDAHIRVGLRSTFWTLLLDPTAIHPDETFHVASIPAGWSPPVARGNIAACGCGSAARSARPASPAPPPPAKADDGDSELAASLRASMSRVLTGRDSRQPDPSLRESGVYIAGRLITKF
jgi:hypothetical protein